MLNEAQEEEMYNLQKLHSFVLSLSLIVFPVDTLIAAKDTKLTTLRKILSLSLAFVNNLKYANQPVLRR